MKKQIIYSLLALTTVCLGACNNNDEIDTANSIFSTEPLERNAFDYWLLDNYTYPYNIDFMYRMKDIESDHKYNLVPADYDKAVALSKIIKHVWMDAYVELAGMDFLRVYVPKTFHLIGSPAYESSGNMVLGTAEGGKKITLYNVNDLNIKKINIEKLNEYYFETMHHEFAHILHQKRNFDPSFNRISEGKYVGADWYYYMTAQGAMPRTDDVAWPDGFVTAYAMSQSNEDFVENIAMYVTHTQAYWDNMMTAAGESGAAIINKKFTIVYNYMRDTWGIDLNELRKIVLRRQQEITENFNRRNAADLEENNRRGKENKLRMEEVNQYISEIEEKIAEQGQKGAGSLLRDRVTDEEIAEIVHDGVQLAVVVGGGNIFRGLAGSAEGMDRSQADYIGMLATVMNALALQDAFERHGIFSRVQSAINMQEVSEPYIRRRAIRHMEKGRVVILAAGTGNPYFTTDTTAALRACELDVDVLMKATKVDGVYDSDPVKNPDAKRYDRISYMEVLSQGLNVMDSTATSLCMDNKVPMIVFDLTVQGNIARALKGEDVGTTVE